MSLSSGSWHKIKKQMHNCYVPHILKFTSGIPEVFPRIIIRLLIDTIPVFSLHHPDFKPIEAWEQKLPVVQCFGVLPQTVVKK
jgi:uncharacterized protein YcsI (UPF0317 family)